MDDISQEELITVIKDFIEMGHVENIVIMFKQDPSLYALTGELIKDERFMVRMGVAVMFEELKEIRPQEVELAIPALLPLLDDPTSYVRGEAISLLATIGGPEAMDALIRLKDDPDSQVREIVADASQE